jgi:hypothetical protein
MPRNISFAMTTEQVRKRTKTVTRRMGWKNLRQGEVLTAVVKCQGLKKGERVETLATIRVKDARREFLDRMEADPVYGLQECAREGFDFSHPMGTPASFIDGFCASHKGCRSDSIVTRIEFEYV